MDSLPAWWIFFWPPGFSQTNIFFCLALPIETGRWGSSPREERLCTVCGVLGDERHAIYECSLVIRDDIVLNEHIHRIWDQPDIFKLFERLRAAKFL